MTMEDYGEPPAKLRCHNCYLSVHGMYCMTMEDFSKIEMQECLDDEHYCMVSRLGLNLSYGRALLWGTAVGNP